MRSAVAVLRVQVVARLLLFAGQNDRLCAAAHLQVAGAKDLLVKEIDDALFEERIDHRRRNTGKIADLSHGHRAAHGEQLRDLLLLGRERLGLRVKVGRQRRHLHHRVVDLAKDLLRLIEQAAPGQFVGQRAVGESKVLGQLFELHRAALLFEIVIQALFFFRQRSCFIRLPHAVNRGDTVVDACRQHGLDRVVEGAEIMLLHKPRDRQHLRREHGRLVSDGENGLQPLRFLRSKCGDDPLTAAVASAKGHQHALADGCRGGQIVRHRIIKFSVKGIDCLFDRDFGNKLTAHPRQALKD